MRELSLGFSPCPNDTFIFYGLATGKVNIRDLALRLVIKDVEALNRTALGLDSDGQDAAEQVPAVQPDTMPADTMPDMGLDITKVSFHAYGYLRDRYELLSSGSALGRGCGPLVVSKKPCSMKELRGKRIAVPGAYTTAHLLLKLYESVTGPLDATILVMPFDRIMKAVAEEEVAGGVIIHESRFTCHLYGLARVADLGAWWEEYTEMPIPLGCIIARKDLGPQMIREIDEAIRSSLLYARSHHDEALAYGRGFAQELSTEVMESHIGLYVNDFTEQIGQEGRAAVEVLFAMADEKRIFLR